MSNIFLETESIKRPFTLIINGKPGIGKTTLALHAPKPVVVVLGRESGVDAMKAPKLVNKNAICGVEFANEAIRYLIKSEHDFETVIFDNLFTYKESINEVVIKENPVITVKDTEVKVTDVSQYPYGRGAGLTKPYWEKLITGSKLLRDRKNMNVIFLSQPEKKTIKPNVSESYDIMGLCLPASGGADIHTLFESFADIILHMEKSIPTKTIKGFVANKKAAIAGEQITTVYASPGQGGFISKNRYGIKDFYEVEESENPRQLMNQFDNATYKEIFDDILLAL
jgi:hypothetical protein